MMAKSWFKSFFGGSAFTSGRMSDGDIIVGAQELKAFSIIKGFVAEDKYNECPPLATGLNKITRSFSSLNVLWHDESDVPAKAQPFKKQIQKFQRQQDMALLVREVLCGGVGYVVLVGNIGFEPSKIETIYSSDLWDREDPITRNVYQLNVTQGLYVGTYNQDKVGSDTYHSTDKLATIIRIKNQVSNNPLSPISAAIATVTAGYNQNYKTIKNGGRLASVWTFKDPCTEEELTARKRAIHNRVREGGVTVTNGELDVKEMGLSTKDMDWMNLLQSCRLEIYNFLGIPLAMISNEASTFNNLTFSAVMLYEDTVLPLADYIFGVIGDVLAARPSIKTQGLRLMVDRQSIDALQDKQVSRLKEREETEIMSIDELRGIINLPPVVGGDELLVDARKVRISDVGNTL